MTRLAGNTDFVSPRLRIPDGATNSTATPGDVATYFYQGTAQFDGEATEITITNPTFKATDTVIVTLLDKGNTPVTSGGRVSVVEPLVDGAFTIRRANTLPVNQRVKWQVWK